MLENPWFTCYLPKINKLLLEGLERAGGVVIIDLEIWIIDEYMYLREQGWRSGESTRLPPMWPGFKSRGRCHMWVEFVVGSLPCSVMFFSWYSGFPLSSKTNTFKFQFDLERTDTFKWVHMNSLSALWVKKQFTIYNFLHCTFQVTSKIIYCYCTLLSNWDNGERRSRGASCHCKGTLRRWPYLEKMLLFDCYLLCPSTVSLNLWRQTLWHTSGLRQLVNERLYPPLWMKGYFIWRLIITITKLSNLVGYQLPWFQP